MGHSELTMDDLRRLLRRVAGENGDSTMDTVSHTTFDDVEFGDLGYDSLAVLEAAREVERQYGVTLSDEAVTDSVSPRLFLDLINSAVARTRASAQTGGTA